MTDKEMKIKTLEIIKELELKSNFDDFETRKTVLIKSMIYFNGLKHCLNELDDNKNVFYVIDKSLYLT